MRPPPLILLLLGLVFVAIPYLWILLTAFKRPVDAASVPPEIFSPFTLANFQQVFKGQYLVSLLNSVIITVLTTTATMAFGVPAGYAFARGRFLGKRFLAGWLLFSRMVPPVIFIIPLFLFFHQLGLINSFLGLTLAYLTGLLPFTIWMTSSYFRDIPVELEEAARVDGGTRAVAFFRIALPLALPGVLTVGVLIAIAAWSEYFVPLLLAGPEHDARDGRRGQLHRRRHDQLGRARRRRSDARRAGLHRHAVRPARASARFVRGRGQGLTGVADTGASARHALVDELATERLVAIIRAGQEVDVAQVAEILLAGRIRFIEVTLTTPGRDRGDRGARSGIGTTGFASAPAPFSVAKTRCPQLRPASTSS